MPTKRGLPVKGDHVTTPDGVVIGVVVKRDGCDVKIQRPGRKIISTIRDFNTWKEQYGWLIK